MGFFPPNIVNSNKKKLWLTIDIFKSLFALRNIREGRAEMVNIARYYTNPFISQERRLRGTNRWSGWYSVIQETREPGLLCT